MKAWRAHRYGAPREVLRLHARLLALLEEGKIRTLVRRVAEFAELPEALAALEQRETIGRTVLRVA